MAVADHGRIIARGDRAELLATVPGHELRPPTPQPLYAALGRLIPEAASGGIG